MSREMLDSEDIFGGKKQICFPRKITSDLLQLKM